MLESLYRAEEALPKLLLQREIWKSLLVDYHPPIVERLWCPWEGGRMYLHCIHPCGEDEALFHRHGWPSAVRILSGRYEMGVGLGSKDFGNIAPPLAAKMILDSGSEYEMVDPDAWHYVRPLEAPSLSLMVTGAPWSNVEAPKSTKPLGPLSVSAQGELFESFRFLYNFNK